MAKKGRRGMFDVKDTLCWYCKNSGGLCSWSNDFTPVDGWETITDKRKNANGVIEDSYIVIDCPEFVEDKFMEDSYDQL